jgi:hypothetical protein
MAWGAAEREVDDCREKTDDKTTLTARVARGVFVCFFLPTATTTPTPTTQSPNIGLESVIFPSIT